MNTLLRAADPAAGVEFDAAGPAARQLLDDVLATPRRRRHVRAFPARRVAVGGAVAASAAVAALLVHSPSQGSRIGPAGFSVSRDSQGTVHAVVRWSALADPAALQAALDRAGARTKVFVEAGDSATTCRQTATTVPYSAHAVQWHAPDEANADNGIVVRPDEFPADGTFVLVVELAVHSSTRGSTFAAGFPQITGTLSYMAVGPAVAPSCG